MNKDKKILAIIPARQGSKGLPGKNKKPLCGKPLIAWTLEQAKKSRFIDRIVVSTDDAEIAKISEECGVKVPFLRPRKLAQDKTGAMEVVLHLLDKLKKDENYLPDMVLLLQPTSPLRTVSDIESALRMLFSNKEADAVVSICETAKSPYWMRVMTDEGFIKYFIKHKYVDYRRQDLPKTYSVNGALYLCKTPALLKWKTFSPKNTIGYLMPKERSVDIDDIIDFNLAEFILSGKKALK